MDHIMKLTPEEQDRYMPYFMWSEFTEGYDDYVCRTHNPHHQTREPIDPNTVAAQAYDRGQECAMRRYWARQRETGR